MAAFGFEESLVWDNLWIVAIESRWGQGWVWQALAASVTWVVSLAVAVGWTSAWPLATAGVVGCVLAVPLVGHAAGDPLRMTLHGTHVLGAGAWIGSLFVLFVDLIRRRCGTAAFQLFAPVALTGTAIIALSGLIAAASYVSSMSALFSTAYGRALLVKVALFAAAGAYGYSNWRQMQRVSAGTQVIAGDAMARTAGRELAFAAAIVLATGVLTELPNP
jgi:putative copper export protein